MSHPIHPHRIKHLTLLSLAAAVPMGQQTYDTELIEGTRKALADDWELQVEVVRSLRSQLPGTRRLPLVLRPGASESLRRLAGLMLLGGRGVTHRLDLRIPPVAREIVTVHDLAPYRFDDEGALPRDAAASLRRALAIVTPSAFAASELERFLGVGGARVIPNGCPTDIARYPPLDTAELGSLGIEMPFVLHLGGASQRKNLETLAKAWRLISNSRQDVHLVLCGPDHPRRNALFGGSATTHALGKVKRRVVVGLLRRSAALVVPSLYEGFGFPALEAMAAGTPLVASNTGALPEVCADGALLVVPDPGCLASAILEVIEGGSAVGRMVETGLRRARQFTWQRSIAAHVSLYEEFLA